MSAAVVEGVQARAALPPDAGLHLAQLQCIRARRVLFSDLTLSVPHGHVLRVLGANGAGKTSLLRIVCGLLSPHQGKVWWNGRRITELREEFGRQLIFLGHAPGLKGELSALENLQVTAALAGVGFDPAHARQALADAGLTGHERVPVRTLSQGQRRRAALARLVLAPTRLWVLDEPFNALDTAATQWLIGLIGRQAARGGIVVLTSHQNVELDTRVPRIELQL